MMPFADKKALDILFDTYWSSSGWKNESERKISPTDFEYAKAAGLMFEPKTLTHDEAVDWIVDMVARHELATVADAFLTSLSTRRLDLRSALGSYMVFQHFRPHKEVLSDGRSCQICGLYTGKQEYDLNVLSFERHKWGGVRHSDVIYAAMDLELLLRETLPKPRPEDISILANLIEAASLQSPEMTSAKFQTKFSKILPSNKSERDMLISILGFCNILVTKDHPGYLNKFIPKCERELPNRRFVDMAYPVCWWTGKDGVNRENLNLVFGKI